MDKLKEKTFSIDSIENEELKDILHDTKKASYLTDAFSYSLLYVSPKMMEKMHLKDVIGEPCYKVLNHLEAPCPFCKVHSLSFNSFYTREYLDPLHDVYILSGKLFKVQNKVLHVETIKPQEIKANESSLSLMMDKQQFLLNLSKILLSSTNSKITLFNALNEISKFYHSNSVFLWKSVKNTSSCISKFISTHFLFSYENPHFDIKRFNFLLKKSKIDMVNSYNYYDVILLAPHLEKCFQKIALSTIYDYSFKVVGEEIHLTVINATSNQLETQFLKELGTILKNYLSIQNDYSIHYAQNKQLELLENKLPCGLSFFDVHKANPSLLTFTYHNDYFFNMLGYNKEEFQLVNTSDLIKEEDRDDFYTALKESLRYLLPFTCKVHMKMQNNSYALICINARVIKFENNKFTYCGCTTPEKDIIQNETIKQTFSNRENAYFIWKKENEISSSIFNLIITSEKFKQIRENNYNDNTIIKIQYNSTNMYYAIRKIHDYYIAINITEIKRNENSYENELQNRKIISSDLYASCVLNISLDKVVECLCKDHLHSNQEKNMGIDAFFQSIASNIHEEEHKKLYLSTFSLKNIQDSYNRGINHLEATHSFNDSHKDAYYLRTQLVLKMNPLKEELIAFLYAYDYSRYKQNEIILHKMVDHQCEAIYLLNIYHDSYRIILDNANQYSSYDNQFTYSKYMDFYARNRILPAEKEKFINQTKIINVVQALQKNEKYSTFFHFISQEGELKIKMLLFFYFDHKKENVIVMLEDITNEMQMLKKETIT